MKPGTSILGQQVSKNRPMLCLKSQLLAGTISGPQQNAWPWSLLSHSSDARGPLSQLALCELPQTNFLSIGLSNAFTLVPTLELLEASGAQVGTVEGGGLGRSRKGLRLSPSFSQKDWHC